MMKFRIQLGNWTEQRENARAIRSEVFLIEQNVPIELEWDEMDEQSIHAVAFDDKEQPIGTGRLLPDGHIGRMAVTKILRGNGVGAALLHTLMRAAKERGDHEAILNAQISAEGFYARYGFQRVGSEFMEAGIPHIEMRCVLNSAKNT